MKTIQHQCGTEVWASRSRRADPEAGLEMDLLVPRHTHRGIPSSHPVPSSRNAAQDCGQRQHQDIRHPAQSLRVGRVERLVPGDRRSEPCPQETTLLHTESLCVHHAAVRQGELFGYLHRINHVYRHMALQTSLAAQCVDINRLDYLQAGLVYIPSGSGALWARMLLVIDTRTVGSSRTARD